MSTGHLQKTFGRNLRAYRLGLGMSQERFAAEIDLHRTYVGSIERGEKNLTLQSIEYYCSLLEVDPLQMLQARDDAAAHAAPRKD